MYRRSRRLLPVVLSALVLAAGAGAAVAQTIAPRIFLDQPQNIVDYQLNRLTPDQLASVERKDDDPRYRPVYRALLLRDRLAPAIRDEAATALVKLGAPSRTHVIIDALGRLPATADVTADQLTRLLLAQSVDELRRQSTLLVATTSTAAVTMATRAAYAALALIDPSMATAWTTASPPPGHLPALIRGLALLPIGPLADRVRAEALPALRTALASGRLAGDDRAAAILTLAVIRPDAETVASVAPELLSQTDVVRAAAVRALAGVPVSAWADAAIEPAITAIAAWVASVPPAARAAGATTDALALAASLAGRLPATRAAERRREIRGLGAEVVRITALPEQVSFDVRWFVVQAGRPVQIVLVNPDAMPHNVVIGRPGAVEAIGTAAASMAPSPDPAVKPYVPALPSVLFSTRLVQQGESERLVFTAPTEPGAYVFLCTFPGHWLRMYGVMLVVPDIGAWEASPTVPIDPMTKQPFTSRTNP